MEPLIWLCLYIALSIVLLLLMPSMIAAGNRRFDPATRALLAAGLDVRACYKNVFTAHWRGHVVEIIVGRPLTFIVRGVAPSPVPATASARSPGWTPGAGPRCSALPA